MLDHFSVRYEISDLIAEISHLMEYSSIFLCCIPWQRTGGAEGTAVNAIARRANNDSFLSKRASRRFNCNSKLKLKQIEEDLSPWSNNKQPVRMACHSTVARCKARGDGDDMSTRYGSCLKISIDFTFTYSQFTCESVSRLHFLRAW